MRRMAIGAAVAAAVVGVGGGAAAALVVGSSAASGSSDAAPSPVPAVSPSVPFVPTSAPPSIVPDVDYPALTTPTRFTRLTVGNSLQTWSVVKPRGWLAYCIGDPEPVDDDQVAGCTDRGVLFRPAGEPSSGGYALRIQTVSYQNQNAAAYATNKTAALRKGYPQVQLLTGSNDSSDYFTLLTPRSGGGFLLRQNFFQWFPADPDVAASLEMSVSGRAVDDAGLRGLFSAFAARIEPVDD